MAKKVFKIPCVWMMCGEYEVEAETLKQAYEIMSTNIDWARSPLNELPSNGKYIDDSFEIDEDSLMEMYSDDETLFLDDGV